MRATVTLLFLILIAVLTPAQAHTRSQSFSTWIADGNALRGVYQVDAYRATQLSAAPQDLGVILREHLARTVSLVQGGAACRLDPLKSLEAPRGDLRVEFRFICPQPLAAAPLLLTVAAFFDVSISHVHYLRVTLSRASVEAILSDGRRDLVILGERRPWRRLC